MSTFCETCDAWRPTPHTCFPVYEVRDATYDGIGIQPEHPWDFLSEVHASDAEAAAERYAKDYDTDGYFLSRSESNEIVVEIRPASDRDKVRRFKCRAEHSVSYYADEVEAPFTEAIAPASAGEGDHGL